MQMSKNQKWPTQKTFQKMAKFFRWIQKLPPSTPIPRRAPTQNGHHHKQFKLFFKYNLRIFVMETIFLYYLKTN
ncbi:hypothetical protein pb186bvf_005401 [Paramecium bursaria]